MDMILDQFKRREDKFFSAYIVFKKNHGQSLIEVMAALGVVAVVIVGIAILAFSSLRDVQHGRNRVQASRLVSEGLEQARVVRDQKGWASFSSYPVPGCYKVNTSSSPWSMQGLASCSGEYLSVPLQQFRRVILIEDQTLVDPSGCSAGCPGRKVTVSVFWEDAQGQQTSSASTILTKWK